jgi:hypothetical protein
VLWTRHFLRAQEYEAVNSVVHQDNKSAMLLEENGRASSSSKHTRHLNIQNFFVTDHVKAKEVRIKYCPTGDMVSDCFTKPLQGSLFRKLQNLIMNVDPNAATNWDHRAGVCWRMMCQRGQGQRKQWQLQAPKIARA